MNFIDASKDEEILNSIFGYQGNIIDESNEESLTTPHFLKILSTKITDSSFKKESPNYVKAKKAITSILNSLWNFQPTLSFLFHQYDILPKHIIQRMSDVFVASFVILAEKEKNIFNDLDMRKTLSSLLNGEALIKNTLFSAKKTKGTRFNNKLTTLRSLLIENEIQNINFSKIIVLTKPFSYDILSTLMNEFRENKNPLLEKLLVTEYSALLKKLDQKNIQTMDLEVESIEKMSDEVNLINQFKTWHLSQPSIKNVISNQKNTPDAFKTIIDKIQSSTTSYENTEETLEILIELQKLLQIKNPFTNNDLGNFEIIIQNLHIKNLQIKNFLEGRFEQFNPKIKIIWLALLAKKHFPQESIHGLQTILSDLDNNKIDIATRPEIHHFQNWHPLVQAAFCFSQSQCFTLGQLLHLCLSPELNSGEIIFPRTEIFKPSWRNAGNYFAHLTQIILNNPSHKIDKVINEFDDCINLRSRNSMQNEMVIEPNNVLSDSDRFYCLNLIINSASDGYNDAVVDEWITQAMSEIFERTQTSPEDKSAVILFYSLVTVLMKKPQLMQKVQNAIQPTVSHLNTMTLC